MFGKAPRRLARAWQRCMRGASFAFGLGLAGAAAAPLSAQEIIVGAEFHGETDRYAHCVLGDCLEWDVLEIVSRDGSGTLFSRSFGLWPSDFVFEDLEPRLWDITGDGAPEVVVVKSSFTRGAALVVYGVDGVIAQTEHIGQRNRWLAPVGAADFDGDGRIEVAFVDRPHLAKTLRVFEWDGNGLVLDGALAGVTNHRIGEAFISGGVRDCGAGPEMVLASGDWRDVVIVRMDGALAAQAVAGYSAGALSDALACRR